jgi:thaumarchaeosortase
MFLSFEYLVFSAILAATVALEYGVHDLGNYAISTLFSGLIGAIYVIDNLYPYGRFTPFQVIVPMTASLAMNFLNLIGYRTLYVGTSANMPVFVARDSQGHSSQVLAIAWPCSGVESLLIYSVTLLLFLKNSSLSWLARIAYFLVGAIVTYVINALRIATIFVISAQGGNIDLFHNYYGQLYSIVWIISYPLIILGLQSFWNLRKARKQSKSASQGS